MTVLLGVAALTAVLAALAWWVLRLVHVCPPDQVLILAGTTTRMGHRIRGYRALSGGWGLRLPGIERVFRLELEPLSLDIEIVSHANNAVVVRLAAHARVRLPVAEPRLGEALECLLGKSHEQIADMARMVVRGNAAGVLSTLRPEEVDQEREQLARQIQEESEHALSKLGLELEAFEIREVEDDSGYLLAWRRERAARAGA